MRKTKIAILLLAAAGLGPVVAPADAGGADAATPVLVKASVPLTASVASDLSRSATHVSFVWPEIGWMAATATASQVAALERDPRVLRVEADRRVTLPDVVGSLLEDAAAPSATTLDDGPSAPRVSWNLDMADTPGSGFDGSGVTVAIVDSGLPQNWREFLDEDSVDTEHAAGFGPLGGGTETNPAHVILGEGGYLGLNPHGLAVSSLVVGFHSRVGRISGAAPGATILPIRIVDAFNHYWNNWLVGALLYVTNLKRTGTIAGPVVINLSLDGDFDPSVEVVTDAIDYAIDQGVIVVTIAGNRGPTTDSISYPGRLPRVITVGMVGWVAEAGLDPVIGLEPAGLEWAFEDVPEDDPSQVYVCGRSGRESDPPASPSLIDVLAPGSLPVVEILTGKGYSEDRQVASVDDFLVGTMGTSFAAPHVTGIVAQMLQKNPALTQAQAETILRSTALYIPPDPDGVVTPLWVPETPFGPGSMYWGPWGASATGAGLARGAAAVAATPAP